MGGTPAHAATITLKFDDAQAFADALRSYSGEHGAGGLCIQVVKYYELGDQVQLFLDCGEAKPLPICGVVAWRKPGYVGVRFQPANAEENRTLVYVRRLLAEAQKAAANPPPVAEAAQPTKPFSE